MKRIYYTSEFARPLTDADLEHIQRSSANKNAGAGISGFLVSLGNVFFQALEGPDGAVDGLYEEIRSDTRHKNVVCLLKENDVDARVFPEWHMKVFNLDADSDALPLAFRATLTALLHSQLTISKYTQPSVIKMLEQGVDPTSVAPSRKVVTVLYSDIIGFSRFAEHVGANALIELVNRHAGICTSSVSQSGGQVTKLLGDGVLAYFDGETSDAGIEASLAVLRALDRSRASAPPNSALRYLYGGVGLAHGVVLEGNVGSDLKRDFTILGNTVNLAARLESMTRDLGASLIVDPAAAASAREPWELESLGQHRPKGQSKPVELFTVDTGKEFDVPSVYRRIEEFVSGVMG